MSSWRINTSTYDKSQSVDTSITVQGATAIKAPRGPERWVYFDQGSTSDIIATYGYPSSTYPAIQDVIDFNNTAGLWVSAPSTAGKLGGAFVTTTGTVPFVSGVDSTTTITDYSEIPCTTNLGSGNGILTTFTLTLPNFAHYNSESIDILVGGATITLTHSVASGTDTLTSSAGTGTLIEATGVLSFTFTSAPLTGVAITVAYTINLASTCYFTLYDQNPQTDNIEIEVTKDATIPGAFYIAAFRYDAVQEDYIEIKNSPFHVSIFETGKDGNGNNIYIKNVFNTDQKVFTATVQATAFTTFTDDTTAKLLVGGSRGTTISDTDLATAYNDLQDATTYGNIEIMFDCYASSNVATAFETLRNSYQKYCRYILCASDQSASSLITNASTITTIDNRGIYFYCLNWGEKKDTYQGNNFTCSNMGLIAAQMANVLITGPGGNPAWINENGIGGQLGSSIVKLNQTATEAQLKQLDSARLNPIVYDPVYGPMIVSWRTRQSSLSDLSYIGQSSLLDYIIKSIVNKVLPFQIGKLNDVTHRDTVKGRTQLIFSNLTKWISDYAIICDDSNNTAEVLQQQKFVLSVGMVFIPYANTIQLNVIVGKQGTDVKVQIKNS